MNRSAAPCFSTVPTMGPTASRLAAACCAFLLAGVANASALSDAANGMEPGEWRTLTTNNINQTLTASGASSIVFGYTEDIVWDSQSRQLFFIGGDHNDAPQFVSYSEQSNAWQRLSRPGWMGSGTMHGYDHSAIDVQGRFLYHVPYNSMTVQRYEIDNQRWTSLPSIPGSVMGYNSCCVGLEWFPELGALIYASVESGTNGSLAKWDKSSNQWSRVTQPELPMGGLHNFAEYNPVHKVAIFGGGNGSRNVYRVDAAGKVTTMKQAPNDLGIQASMVTVDPVSGDYLVFTDDRQFYVYNVTTDTWQLQSGGTSLPIWTTSYGNPVHGVVVAPISTYGVNLFVRCNAGNDCRVHLYKHGPGTVPQPPKSPTNLDVQ